MLHKNILSRFTLVISFILPMIAYAQLHTSLRFDALYEAGVDAALKGDYINGVQTLIQAVQILPTHFEARQLLGSCYVAMGNFPDAVTHLAEAYRMNKYGGKFLVSNYIEALRRTGELEKSISTGLSFLEERPGDADVLINTGVALQEAKEEKRSLDMFIRCVNAEPTKLSCWERSINVLLEMGEMVDAERVAEDALKQFPRIANIHCLLGLAKHYQSKFPEALNLYLQCLELNPQHDMVWTNIGAVHQSLGNVEESFNAYDHALGQLRSQNISLNKGHAGLLNNYGSLMTIIGREAEGVDFLQRALELDPDMENVNVNLGSHFQDEGDLVTAEHHFREAIRITRKFAMTSANKVADHSILFDIRIALMLRPIALNWGSMIRDRQRLENNLIYLLRFSESTGRKEKVPLDASLDRTHFYISYHGVNDRFIQEMVMETYRRNIRDVEWWPQLASSQFSPESVRQLGNSRDRKIRIGFISKFFGIFEPHGLLLDGVMKYLPRSRFYVVALPVARTDGKPLAPSIQSGVDLVVEIPLSHEYARSIIIAQQLDILVFADTMSEPMNHFLAHSRMAPVQAAFWGNPITSGSRQIDYFISADCMEHPYRTRLQHRDEPYTEQVVLLEGQGIWYYTPEDPELSLQKANFSGRVDFSSNVFLREEFGFESNWFLFFCPQSTFKIHPLFDNVIADLLSEIEKAGINGHVVVTGGRKQAWTEVYSNRLKEAVGPHLLHRLHIIPRVSAEKFLNLIKIADLLLHPFPFDGSRTSADGLSVHVPYVTLPSEHLRGRMGAAFYRTMNIPELVARNKTEYIQICVRLAKNRNQYLTIREKISARSHLIWEDMEVPFRWTQYFSVLAGLPVPNWEEFIRETGRDPVVETELFETRQKFRKAFESTWGEEKWMLDREGRAPLVTTFGPKDHGDGSSLIPPIFNDWNWNYDNNVLKSSRIEASTPDLDASLEAFMQQEELDLNEFKRLTMSSMLSEALNFGFDLLSKHRSFISDPINVDRLMKLFPDRFEARQNSQVVRSYRESEILLDLGVVEYFSGNFDRAYNLCVEANNVVRSHLAFACLGVTGTYLNKENETIFALYETWKTRFEAKKVNSRIFHVPFHAMLSNLITALNSFARAKECIKVGSEALDIPSIGDKGGMWLLAAAMFSWSDERRDIFKNLENNLRSTNKLVLLPGRNLFDEVRRIQDEKHAMFNVLYECVFKDSSVSSQWDDIIGTLMNIIDLPLKTLAVTGLHVKPAVNPPVLGIVLIAQYYMASQYQGDIDEALQRNLNHDAITNIVLLNEAMYDLSKFANHSKITQVNIKKRLQFSDAFEYANHNLIGRTVVLANSDIYFDETLNKLIKNDLDLRNRVFALLKWKKTTEGATISLRTDSQDAWIFKAPLNSSLLNLANFDMGAVRCDNVLANILKKSGHPLLNPCLAIHAIEIQTRPRQGLLYGTKDSLFVEDGDNVPIADFSDFLISR